MWYTRSHLYIIQIYYRYAYKVRSLISLHIKHDGDQYMHIRNVMVSSFVRILGLNKTITIIFN